MINRKIIVLSMLSILSGFACTKEKPAEQQEKSKINQAFTAGILTTKVETIEREDELTLAGRVEYNPEKLIRYTPLFSGIVEKMYFSLGDKVEKDHKLLDIRSADLSAMHTEFNSLEAEIRILERETEMAQALYEDNMLSKREWLEAQAKLKQANLAAMKLKHDMAAFGTSTENGLFSLKSPLTGHVVENSLTAGSIISSESEPVFVLADLNTVWITVNVYPGNLLYVKEGMEVEITSLSYPDEIFSGKIDRMSHVFDPEEKVLKAIIIMENKELKFKPGMSVTIGLKNKTTRKQLAVPSDALIFDDDNYFTIVKEGEEFMVRQVEPDGHYRNTTYITAGLSENDEIVIKNQLLIYSGLNDK